MNIRKNNRSKMENSPLGARRRQRSLSLITIHVSSEDSSPVQLQNQNQSEERSDRVDNADFQENISSLSVATFGDLRAQPAQISSCTILQAYFRIASYAGLTSYKYPYNYETTDFWKMINKVPYVLVCVLVSVSTLAELRQALMYAGSIGGSTEVGEYVLLGKWFASISLRLVFMHNIYTNIKIYEKLFGITDSSLFYMVARKKKNLYVVAVILLLSLIIAIGLNTYDIPDKPTNITGVEWCLYFHWRESYVQLTAKNWTEYTKNAANYPESVTTLSMISGGVALLARILSRVMVYIGNDMILCVAVSLFEFSNYLDENTTGSESFINHYLDLKHLSKLSNKAIRNIYIFSLLYNLLLISNAYNEAINLTPNSFQCIGMVMEILKMLATYSLAHNVSTKMENIRDWIIDVGIRESSNSEVENLKWIAEEIAEGAIGLGRGGLIVNTVFLINYFGVTIAYFLSVVESRN